MRSIAVILKGFPRLFALVERESDAIATVSAWSIGQHLEHLIKVHANILDLSGDPPRGTPCPEGITMTGRLVLLTGIIPRGRGRSPARFMPESIPASKLAESITDLAQRFTALGRQPTVPGDANVRFAHPVFGGLTRRQWLRFAEIHQSHHVAIMEDIVRAKAT